MGKKNLAAVLTAATLAIGCCGAFAACGHEHTYSEDWEKDATGHWHVATCDDLQKGDEEYTKDFAKHNYGNDNECDTCKYVKQEAPGHTHSYTKWDKSETEHWKYCEADNEIDESTRGGHDYGDSGVCECGKEDPNAEPPYEDGYTITLNVGEGTPGEVSEVKTNAQNRLSKLPTAPTAPKGKYFIGWYTAAEDGEKVTLETEFEEDGTIYALFQAEVTVTLNAGVGTLAATSYNTVNGMIPLGEDEWLPVPVAPAHYTFINWFDEDDNEIDEHEAVFTVDTELVAKYKRDNGVWVGDTFKAAMVKNGGMTPAELQQNSAQAQYWLGGSQLVLQQGDVISFYIDGKLISFGFTTVGSSSCVTPSSGTGARTSVTVSEAAKFNFYLWHYNDGGWACQFAGTALNTPTVDEIPVGCESIKVTAANGTVIFYVVSDTGVSINNTNWSGYCFYSWNDQIFSGKNPPSNQAWNLSTTYGTFAAEKDVSDIGSIGSDFGMKVRWSNGTKDSSDIKGIEVNSDPTVTNVYLINLKVAKDKAFLYVGEPLELGIVGGGDVEEA